MKKAIVLIGVLVFVIIECCSLFSQDINVSAHGKNVSAHGKNVSALRKNDSALGKNGSALGKNDSALSQNDSAQRINETKKINETVEMDDILRSNGKIYVVVAVLSVVFLGIIVFLISIDRKVKKLEEEVGN